jgi:iron complex transport system substrate-binding protein
LKINNFCIAIILLAILSLAIACISPRAQQETNGIVPVADNKSLAGGDQREKTQAYNPDIEPLPEYPITVHDDLGREVVISSLPKRIVSLAPSNTETLFALGLDDRIVGVTDYCDFPEAAKTKTRVASYTNPDVEKLVSLKPDLVVAESIHEKTVLPVLERLGMTVFVTEATTLDAVLNDISLLGKITGRTHSASRLLDSMNAKIGNVISKTEKLAKQQRLRVLYVNWHDPIWTMGRKTYINDVINKAGGVNVYAEDFEKARAVSLESVVTKNPQVIFVSGMGTSGDAVYNGIKDEVRLYTVDAVTNNRIFKISDANLIERPGPRVVDGLMEVARMIHPELFGEYK